MIIANPPLFEVMGTIASPIALMLPLTNQSDLQQHASSSLYICKDEIQEARHRESIRDDGAISIFISRDSAPSVNTALLPLSDLLCVPGDGLGTNGNRRWQHTRLHLAPDCGAGPAGGLDDRRQAEEFFSRGHTILLRLMNSKQWRVMPPLRDSSGSTKAALLYNSSVPCAASLI